MNTNPNLPKFGDQMLKFKFQMNIPVTAPSHRPQNSELLTSVANKTLHDLSRDIEKIENLLIKTQRKILPYGLRYRAPTSTSNAQNVCL